MGKEIRKGITIGIDNDWKGEDRGTSGVLIMLYSKI